MSVRFFVLQHAINIRIHIMLTCKETKQIMSKDINCSYLGLVYFVNIKVSFPPTKKYKNILHGSQNEFLHNLHILTINKRWNFDANATLCVYVPRSDHKSVGPKKHRCERAFSGGGNGFAKEMGYSSQLHIFQWQYKLNGGGGRGPETYWTENIRILKNHDAF